MVQQTNIRTLNLPRLNFSHEIIHSVFDSDVCCFNEVITIPQKYWNRCVYIRKVSFWSKWKWMSGSLFEKAILENAKLYCILWVMSMYSIQKVRKKKFSAFNARWIIFCCFYNQQLIVLENSLTIHWHWLNYLNNDRYIFPCFFLYQKSPELLFRCIYS